MLEWLWQLSFYSASAVFLLLNIMIFLGALAAGRVIDHFFRPAQVARRKVTATELILSLSTVCINSAITSAGWLLWREGVIRLNTHGTWWQIARDTAVLVLAMDFALYILHRIAHIPVFYKLAHYKHHEYGKARRPYGDDGHDALGVDAREVRVLTLFVMSPVEALGFGSLWVVTLCFFPFTIEAVLIFLNLNLYFGITAHCGVTLYPAALRRAIGLAGFTVPDFHRAHHEDERINMGFYTSLWDKLLGTVNNDK